MFAPREINNVGSVEQSILLLHWGFSIPNHQQVTRDAAKSAHRWMFTLCVSQTNVCLQKDSALCHDTLLPVKNHCCPALHREKAGQSKSLCKSQAGGIHHGPSPSPSLLLHSSMAALKIIMKRYHLSLGERKENSLAAEGKTATIYYSNQESFLGTGQ